MLIFWILIIAIVSVVWALLSLKKERQRHEIEKAKEDITQGRVIFHSSADSESSL